MKKDYSFVSILQAASARSNILDELFEEGRKIEESWKIGCESSDPLEINETNERFKSTNNVIIKALLVNAAEIFDGCSQYIREKLAEYDYIHSPVAIATGNIELSKKIVKFNYYDETEINNTISGLSYRLNNFSSNIISIFKIYEGIFSKNKNGIQDLKEKMESLHIFLKEDKMFKTKAFENTGFVPNSLYAGNATAALVGAGSSLRDYVKICESFSESLAIFSNIARSYNSVQEFYNLSAEDRDLYNKFVCTLRFASTKTLALADNLVTVAKFGESNWKTINRALEETVNS